jgi:hypothetical protein
MGKYNLDGVSICFLETIYTDNYNNSLLYNVVLSDDKFLNFHSLILKEEDLVELFNTNKNLIYNFKVIDGCLYCDTVDREKVNNMIIDRIGIMTKIVEGHEEIDVINFIDSLAQRDGFIFVGRDDELLDVSLCRSITSMHFSRSTMSIYFKVLKDDKVYNKMIATSTNDSIVMEPLRYLIKGDPIFDDDELIGTFNMVKSEDGINEDYEYNVYLTKEKRMTVGRVLPDEYLDKIYAHKCCMQSYRFRCILKVAQCIIDELTNCGNDEDKKFEWTGGSNSYKQNTDVNIVPSEKEFSKEKAYSIASKALRLAKDYPNGDQVGLESCKVGYKSAFDQLACTVIYNVLTQGMSNCQLTSYLLEFIAFLKMQIFYADFYLYRCRISSFLSDKLFTEGSYLYGSDESGFAIIEGGKI